MLLRLWLIPPLREATSPTATLSSLACCKTAWVATPRRWAHLFGWCRGMGWYFNMYGIFGALNKQAMIANIGPGDYSSEETLSTLRYASRAKNITNQPRVNEDPKARA